MVLIKCNSRKAVGGTEAGNSLEIHCEAYRSRIRIPFNVVVKVDVSLVNGLGGELNIGLTPWPASATETHDDGWARIEKKEKYSGGIDDGSSRC
jgi:hypothetical protein